MPAGLGVDELGSDAQPAARPLDASVEHITDAQLAADLLGVDRFVPIGESAIAGDHERACEPRQVGRQILGDAIRKILLLRIVAEIGERQYDDR